MPRVQCMVAYLKSRRRLGRFAARLQRRSLDETLKRFSRRLSAADDVATGTIGAIRRSFTISHFASGASTFDSRPSPALGIGALMRCDDVTRQVMLLDIASSATFRFHAIFSLRVDATTVATSSAHHTVAMTCARYASARVADASAA